MTATATLCAIIMILVSLKIESSGYATARSPTKTKLNRASVHTFISEFHSLTFPRLFAETSTSDKLQALQVKRKSTIAICVTLGARTSDPCTRRQRSHFLSVAKPRSSIRIRDSRIFAVSMLSSAAGAPAPSQATIRLLASSLT